MLMLGVDTMLPYERFDDRLEHRDVSTPAIIYREILPSVSQPASDTSPPTLAPQPPPLPLHAGGARQPPQQVAV